MEICKNTLEVKKSHILLKNSGLWEIILGKAFQYFFPGQPGKFLAPGHPGIETIKMKKKTLTHNSPVQSNSESLSWSDVMYVAI